MKKEQRDEIKEARRKLSAAGKQAGKRTHRIGRRLKVRVG